MPKWFSHVSSDKYLMGAIFLSLLVSYAYFFPRWADWNQNSRMDQIMAIVDQGVLHIDSYIENTGDYAYFNGHYYSDKAPGAFFLGVPVYAVLKFVSQPFVETITEKFASNAAFQQTLREGGSGLLADKIWLALALTAITLATISVPSAIFGIELYRLLITFSIGQRNAVIAVMAYGLGTIAFPYSGAFYGHQLAAICLGTAFSLLVRGKNSVLSLTRLIGIGALLGLGVISEYPTVIIAACVFFYAGHLLKSRPRGILLIVLGGSVPMILAASYNWSIFRTIFPVAYRYSALFPEHFKSGFLGFALPKLDALWGMFLSPYRGLFFLSPFLLLAAYGFWLWHKNQRFLAEWRVVICSVFLYYLFIASSAAWEGGFAVGPRYLTVVVPFLIIPVAWAIDTPNKNLATVVIFSTLIVTSIGLVWIETIGGQQFPDYRLNPLLQYSWPNIIEGDIARNLGMLLKLKKWFSLLPLLIYLIILGSFLWRSTNVSKR